MSSRILKWQICIYADLYIYLSTSGIALGSMVWNSMSVICMRRCPPDRPSPVSTPNLQVAILSFSWQWVFEVEKVSEMPSRLMATNPFFLSFFVEIFWRVICMGCPQTLILKSPASRPTHIHRRACNPLLRATPEIHFLDLHQKSTFCLDVLHTWCPLFSSFIWYTLFYGHLEIQQNIRYNIEAKYDRMRPKKELKYVTRKVWKVCYPKE